jgi:hypothetical protein
LKFEASPGQITILKKPIKQKGLAQWAQVGGYLPSNHEAMSSNPTAALKTKKN